MSVINSCVSLMPSGGTAPHTLDISALIDSTGPTSQIDVSYCVNAGTPQSVQSMTFTPGPVAGYAYTVSIPGLNDGDVVEIKADVTVATNVSDTGTVTISGGVTQTDALACEKNYSFNEACNWTAVDLSTPPTCPAADTVDCTLLPYTSGTFTGATSITQSGLDLSVYTFTATASGYTIALISGQTATAQAVTVTASNAAGPCTQMLTITCGTQFTGTVFDKIRDWGLSSDFPSADAGIVLSMTGTTLTVTNGAPQNDQVYVGGVQQGATGSTHSFQAANVASFSVTGDGGAQLQFVNIVDGATVTSTPPPLPFVRNIDTAAVIAAPAVAHNVTLTVNYIGGGSESHVICLETRYRAPAGGGGNVQN